MKPVLLFLFLLMGGAAYPQLKTSRVYRKPTSTVYYLKEKGVARTASFFNDVNDTHAGIQLNVYSICSDDSTGIISSLNGSFFNDFPRYGDTAFVPVYVNPGKVIVDSLPVIDELGKFLFSDNTIVSRLVHKISGREVVVKIDGNDTTGYVPQTINLKVPSLLAMEFESKNIEDRLHRKNGLKLRWKAAPESTELILRIHNTWLVDSLGNSTLPVFHKSSGIHNTVINILLNNDGEFELSAKDFKEIPVNNRILIELVRRSRRTVMNNMHPIKVVYEETVSCPKFYLAD